MKILTLNMMLMLLWCGVLVDPFKVLIHLIASSPVDPERVEPRWRLESISRSKP
jgi:hypothetical protein